jgi:hypothetical protein
MRSAVDGGALFSAGSSIHLQASSLRFIPAITHRNSVLFVAPV